MKKLRFEPLATMRYPEMVAEMIQTKILGQDTDPGDRLPTEKQLTEELEVSRSVVREALRLLEAMGMVKVKKGRGGGIFVSHGFHEPWRNSLMALIRNGRITFDQVFEARQEIEPSMAVMACRHASKEDIEELRAYIADSRKHFRDAKRLRANNLGFHVRLAEASGNPILAMMAKSNLEILEELVYTLLELPLEQQFVEVHEGILDAVERGDETEAERRTREDILQVEARLSEIIEKAKAPGKA